MRIRNSPSPVVFLNWCCSLLLALMLAACGGGNEATTSTAPRQLSGSPVKSPPQVADYDTVAQQVYVAFFGRPADPAGLANFQAQLMATGASNTIQALDSEYNSNPALRELIDGFGASPESQRLYGTGSDSSFVTAIYNHLLARDPLLAGLDYWYQAIQHGGLQRSHAVLSIAAAALANSSPQGLQDGTLIGKKISVAQLFTAQVPANLYSGQGAGEVGRILLYEVTSTTDLAAFQAEIDRAIQSLSML